MWTKRNQGSPGKGLMLAGALVLAAGCASNDRGPGLDESETGRILGGVAGGAAGSQEANILTIGIRASF